LAFSVALIRSSSSGGGATFLIALRRDRKSTKSSTSAIGHREAQIVRFGMIAKQRAAPTA
jgi:hypothetical protein